MFSWQHPRFAGRREIRDMRAPEPGQELLPFVPFGDTRMTRAEGLACANEWVEIAVCSLGSVATRAFIARRSTELVSVARAKDGCLARRAL
jgi:hypothetical protein